LFRSRVSRHTSRAENTMRKRWRPSLWQRFLPKPPGWCTPDRPTHYVSTHLASSCSATASWPEEEAEGPAAAASISVVFGSVRAKPNEKSSAAGYGRRNCVPFKSPMRWIDDNAGGQRRRRTVLCLRARLKMKTRA
jgi:hypothetical protein